MPDSNNRQQLQWSRYFRNSYRNSTPRESISMGELTHLVSRLRTVGETSFKSLLAEAL